MRPTSQSMNHVNNKPMRKTISSPTSNKCLSAALDGDSKCDKESNDGLPGGQPDLDLVPMTNLLPAINNNSRECK